ncbi:hypothetical protein [Carboxylicivirga taeanensis]|uniref:hypothetical protein n=1 Tax=Carboxylicivirga taeanensis TaxID=1416875 RepID=UPI003F6DDC0B
MKQLSILLILFLTTLTTSAQTIKAITQHGETVVLFENGTWKYEKDLPADTSSSDYKATVAVRPAVTASALTVDKTREVTSEKTDLFNAVSKRLSRFFGEEKGRVRCAISASNNKGEVSVNFEFMMPVGDANRYFGYTAAERQISLVLADGSVIKSVFSQGIEEKFIEKWNVSYYKASIVLTNEEVNQLLTTNSVRLTVDWKKTEEEYIIDDIEAFKNILSEVI